jgi:hypothetical protein
LRISFALGGFEQGYSFHSPPIASIYHLVATLLLQRLYLGATEHPETMPTINVRPDADLHLQDIADTMGRARKVVVVTGAGISTNCGIPVSQYSTENQAFVNT